ncbi:MAG: histidine phosphatase family protein [Desulfovibrionaceae bacterium]|nr:histidine phosphatase family protein [Desulfovibrionaceae bacterium]
MGQGLLLIRHGALDDQGRRMIGCADISLNDCGRAQMRNVCRHLVRRVCDLVCVVSSDLQRCQESARIIVRGVYEATGRTLPLHADPRLRELSLGAWEGLRRADIEKRWPGSYAMRGYDFAAFVPPGGESFRMLLRRVQSAYVHWRHMYPCGRLCFVTHAGVLRVLIAQHMALPLGDVLRIPLTYAAFCEL